MKVAKCNCEQTESKEPELLTFEQIKKREGIYSSSSFAFSGSRAISFGDGTVLIYTGNKQQQLDPAVLGWHGATFTRTSETLCVGLKDANGKWVE